MGINLAANKGRNEIFDDVMVQIEKKEKGKEKKEAKMV